MGALFLALREPIFLHITILSMLLNGSTVHSLLIPCDGQKFPARAPENSLLRSANLRQKPRDSAVLPGAAGKNSLPAGNLPAPLAL